MTLLHFKQQQQQQHTSKTKRIMAEVNNNKTCKYGEKCYRKNPQHFIEYLHPPKQSAPPPPHKRQAEEDVSTDESQLPIKKARLNPGDALGSEKTPKFDSDEADVDDEILVKACDDVVSQSAVTQSTTSAVTQSISSTDDIEDAGPRLIDTDSKGPVENNPSLTPEYNLDHDDASESFADHTRSKVEDLNGSQKDQDQTVEGTAEEIKQKRPHSDDAGQSSSRQDDDVVVVSNEDDDLLDPKESIKKKFLLDMPQDFYEFWEYAKSLNSLNPSAAFASTLNLHLVGPYDVLAGKCKRGGAGGEKKGGPNYLLHYRYYYDPPEFMTVLKGDDKSLFHMGYFRDDPKELPVFVASNSASTDCILKQRGENVFSAVSWYIDEEIKRDTSNKSKLLPLQKSLKSWAHDKNISMDGKSTRMKERDKRVVTRCFHGAGLVVPVDKNGVGYRELPETAADLKKILKKIVDCKTEEERNMSFDALMEIITLVQFANDECDYGEGLELGLDLFSYGGEVLHKTILGLLPLAYQLLGRHQYARIIEAHLADRRRGANVNQLR